MNEPELEPVWTGVNDGRDGDLLCRELRLPEKRDGQTVRATRLTGTKDLVEATLNMASAPLSMREICNRACLPMVAVNSAVMFLVQQGRVDRTSEPVATSFGRGRPGRLYFVKGRFNGEASAATTGTPGSSHSA